MSHTEIEVSGTLTDLRPDLYIGLPPTTSGDVMQAAPGAVELWLALADDLTIGWMTIGSHTEQGLHDL